ncbi:MAG: hypothetical protein P9M13_02265 [Candidatus Ancaeobacter aquaticus]|nr:hypothetical protein [Candidatus Ancaeobacter aquaticus]
MKKYHPIYVLTFQKHFKQYSGLSARIKKCVFAIIENPYDKTEPLQRELRGLRSARIGRNFRIIFAISEEVQKNKIAKDNFPQFCKFSDNTVIFITIGPHNKAYKLK